MRQKQNTSSLVNISFWPWAWYHTNVKSWIITHISAYLHNPLEIYEEQEILNEWLEGFFYVIFFFWC